MASLVASFLGGLALRDEAARPGWWTVGGVIAFVLVVVVVSAVIWPWKFRFTQDPAILVDWVEQHQAKVAEMSRDLALHLKTEYGFNQKKLDRMFRAYRVAVVLLAFGILTSLFDLRGR